MTRGYVFTVCVSSQGRGGGGFSTVWFRVPSLVTGPRSLSQGYPGQESEYLCPGQVEEGTPVLAEGVVPLRDAH